jgi:hypothetical protein
MGKATSGLRIPSILNPRQWHAAIAREMTRLFSKTCITKQLLRKIKSEHWLPCQTPMCAGFSAHSCCQPPT